jgi:DNA helicase-2/ATP-dependent DNA helicase PcrA
VHLCKGLEFEHVIVAGCEEGIFPHSSSLLDRAQIEEERRLMYVAMTRAKTHLRLLLTRSRLLWGQRQTNAKSRFLDDVPADVSERRSDDVLSAFAWASERAVTNPSRSSGRKLDPFVQQEVAIEFNQDMNQDEESQAGIDVGSRIAHQSFGQGTVTKRRGDVIDVRFDDGRVKTLALSVARVTVL